MGPSTSVDGELTPRVRRSCMMRLQWGRRQASTERRHDRQAPRSGVYASMGPSTSVDGEHQYDHSEMVTKGGFNGAVDKRRRRGDLMSQIVPHACGLQWGRRQASTESRRVLVSELNQI